MTVKPYLLIPFILISALNLIFVVTENRRGKFLTKPLLMPLLIMFYLFNTAEPNYLAVMALVCGFLGDVFLLWEGRKDLLLLGIGAFLAGHIFYITAFLQKSDYLREAPQWFPLFILPYIIAGVMLSKRLLPSMDSMKLPGVIYMGVILSMSLTCLSTVFSIPMKMFLTTYLGSLFFIASDSLLAFDIFKVYRQRNHVWIMATYIIAQFLMALGFLL